MKQGFDTSQSLAQEVLQLYKQAVADRRWEVAEFLMCALEELAKSEPTCEEAVEQAYLCICPHAPPVKA